MPKILISYRREDSAAYAGRIADRLRDQFGADNVFVDIDTIRPGEDYVDAIDRSLSSCTVVVAVIGRRWLDAADGAGRRRLDGGDDILRTEIARALERRLRVVPALVDAAVMPKVSDLPQDLQTLTRRHAIEISDSRFHQDVDRLIEALSDPTPVRTKLLQWTRISADHPTRNSRSLGRLILGTLSVLVLIVAGYWGITTATGGPGVVEGPRAQQGNERAGDSSNVAGARSGAESPTSGDSVAPTTSTASGPVLRSKAGEPVQESEPNDDVLHPNSLALGTTVRAAIRPVTDKDFFLIRTPPGSGNKVRVVISNRSKLMPEVEIRDSNFNSVKSSYKVFGDLYVEFDAAPSAEYFVECRFLTVNQNFADAGDSGAYEVTVLSESAPGRLPTGAGPLL